MIAKTLANNLKKCTNNQDSLVCIIFNDAISVLKREDIKIGKYTVKQEDYMDILVENDTSKQTDSILLNLAFPDRSTQDTITVKELIEILNSAPNHVVYVVDTYIVYKLRVDDIYPEYCWIDKSSIDTVGHDEISVAYIAKMNKKGTLLHEVVCLGYS